MPDDPRAEVRISRAAKRLTVLAMQASAQAAKVSGAADLHDRAATAHAAAAEEWRTIDDGAAREHDRCVALEREYAEAIRRYQRGELTDYPRPMGATPKR